MCNPPPPIPPHRVTATMIQVNARTEADVVLLDDVVAVFRSGLDVHLYVVSVRSRGSDRKDVCVCVVLYIYSVLLQQCSLLAKLALFVDYCVIFALFFFPLLCSSVFVFVWRQPSVCARLHPCGENTMVGHE